MLAYGCMSKMALQNSRVAMVASKQIFTSSVAWKSSGSAQTQMDDFWAKNKRSNRPMSPHLTIYKPQLTSMLSITTRMTGLGLAGATTMFAVGTAAYTGDVASIYSYVDTMHQSVTGTALLFGLKTLIAWPFAFHTCNGLRHLGWDMVVGLGLKEVYAGGWFVVAASFVLSTMLVLMY